MELIREGQHQCHITLSNPRFHGNGAILRCEECNTYWEARVYGNEHYDGWRRVGFIRVWFLKRRKK